MSNHTIDEDAFQEAYKVAGNMSASLADKLVRHGLSDDERTKLKQDVYRAFLEAYLEFNNLKG